METAEVQNLIVDNTEYDKIKNDFKGTNIQIVIECKNGKTINFNLDKGYWGGRVPEVENETLILRCPKDENPIRTVSNNKLTEVYRQEEYCIPCSEIVSINYTYDRLVVSDISEND